MRIASAVLAGAMIAGFAWSSAAQAQGVPRGSYRQSCTEVQVEGGALVATCRTRDGGLRRSSLGDFRRCVGDIGNGNGVLRCSTRGGSMRATELPGPGFGAPRYGEPGPGYGNRERPNGDRRYGDEGRGRCSELRREAERLRDRMRETDDRSERGRLEGRLHDLREQEERCR